MNHKATLITLGFIAAVTPWLGVPQSWKDILIVILGLAIALTAYLTLK